MGNDGMQSPPSHCSPFLHAGSHWHAKPLLPFLQTVPEGHAGVQVGVGAGAGTDSSPDRVALAIKGIVERYCQLFPPFVEASATRDVW